MCHNLDEWATMHFGCFCGVETAQPGTQYLCTCGVGWPPAKVRSSAQVAPSGTAMNRRDSLPARGKRLHKTGEQGLVVTLQSTAISTLLPRQ